MWFVLFLHPVPVKLMFLMSLWMCVSAFYCYIALMHHEDFRQFWAIQTIRLFTRALLG